MILKDNACMRGKLEMSIFRNGKLIGGFCEQNLIVNGARTRMSRLLAGDFTGGEIAGVAFGTNGAEPSNEDQTITDEFKKEITGYSFPNAASVQFDWELEANEYNGKAVMEFGLLCADGVLFARRVRENPIYKEDDISIEGHWTISF
jgi:hypothetical protein